MSSHSTRTDEVSSHSPRTDEVSSHSPSLALVIIFNNNNNNKNNNIINDMLDVDPSDASPFISLIINVTLRSNSW